MQENEQKQRIALTFTQKGKWILNEVHGMKKNILALLVVVVMSCQAAQAAPMQDMDKGKATIDMSKSIHSFEGGNMLDGGLSNRAG